MESELNVLAEAGAVALVKAMATDLWPRTRQAIITLFRHSGHDAKDVEAHLDDHAALLQHAADPDMIRQELVRAWIPELLQVLRTDPNQQEALARLADEIPEVVVQRIGHNVDRSKLEQLNTAHDHGTIFAVQGGDQHAYPTATQPPEHPQK
ncbi:hypothetical protein [Nocardia sp. NPDC020380]|uniref:hypothetical protein n=1 Tax=Nocardia sp. NPDC020380 TaxID=3364309 RepID=UPI0037B41564